MSEPNAEPAAERRDFIRDIVAADLAAGRIGARRHALPARAQRLPAHRPRQVHLPQLRHRGRVRRALQPALRRHQPSQGGAGVHRLDPGGRPLARVRLGREPVPRVGLLRDPVRVGRAPHPRGQRVRRRPLGRRDPRDARHADRAGRELAVSRPEPRGEPGPVRPDARGRVPRRRARPAREDRHGVAEHQPARPVLYRIVHARHSANGRRVVHLPDVRLRPRPSDAIEGVTHSVCTLEFEVFHRPLYDWSVEHLPGPRTIPPGTEAISNT